MSPSPHVGTLGEKPLHADLKRWYAEPGDRAEVPVAGFVIDLVRADLLIEIQTRGFAAMRRKLETLLHQGHSIRLVHPIPAVKWIVKLDRKGRELSRRRSPRRGGTVDLFAELVSLPALLAEPGLEIEILLIHEEEVRTHDPKRAWRRHGWVVVERRLLGVVERVTIREPLDLLVFLPHDLPSEFTTADLASRLGRPRRIAQQMAYCLRESGVIAGAGKRGNAIVYRIP